MSFNYRKLLSAIAVIVALVLLVPCMARAAEVTDYTRSEVMVAANVFFDSNLTPQERQKLQGVRQKRNREVDAILNESQHRELVRYLRSGDDFNQALEKLQLDSDQKKLVRAILDIADVKMKKILSQQLVKEKL